MVQDAEKQSGAVWADDRDPRITRLRTFLRRWHIDEIPQLLNVLKGAMSMVGPRPEKEEISNELLERVPVIMKQGVKEGSGDSLDGYYEKIPYYSQRLSVKPGITGWPYRIVGLMEAMILNDSFSN